MALTLSPQLRRQRKFALPHCHDSIWRQTNINVVGHFYRDRELWNCQMSTMKAQAEQNGNNGIGVLIFQDFVDGLAFLCSGQGKVLTTIPCPVHGSLLAAFRAHGLVVSPKSTLNPAQRLTWLGKDFDLTTGSIRNTEAVLLRTCALCLLLSLAPLQAKVVERFAGHALWPLRPHVGAPLTLRPWYCFPWTTARCLPHATRAIQWCVSRGITCARRSTPRHPATRVLQKCAEVSGGKFTLVDWLRPDGPPRPGN